MSEEELIREFIAEAEEHLSTLEPNLLRLERAPNNQEIINDIFVAAHSIKGTASYVGLTHISNFTHSLEHLLDRLRKGSLSSSPALIDNLLQGVDMLKEFVRCAALGQPAPDSQEITQRLLQWGAESSVVYEYEQSETPEPDAQDDDFAAQLEHLESEDAEIFVDIAGQQFEIIRQALEKIRYELLSAPSESPPTALTRLIKAFRTMKSSAPLLNIDDIQQLFERHDHRFSKLEAPSHILTEEDLHDITGMIQEQEATVRRISHHSSGTASTFPQSSTRTSQNFMPSLESRQRQTLRVDARRVDQLLNLAGELTINRARLEQLSTQIKDLYEALRSGKSSLGPTSAFDPRLTLRTVKKLKEFSSEITQDIGRISNQMQESTMRIRMVPIGQVLNRFPRMVRDLSRQAQKEIAVRIHGAETELDKSVIELIGEPLIHVIRNAIDHGIERPEERERQGKTRQGLIEISAYYEGNQVLVEIVDDGRGLDKKLITEKAVEQQLISQQEANSLHDKELSSLIFHSGFSTVETVSSLSGRGVGLHVVKRYLEKINGTVEVESFWAKGCRFILRLPLTLAIIPALMVQVSTEIFAVPLISVEEALRILPSEIHTVESHRVIDLRGKMLPVFDLAEFFGATLFEDYERLYATHAECDLLEYEEEKTLYALILNDGFCTIAVLVDRFLGENNIVVKPLNDSLLNVKGISGASIRGDGRISLVIDPVSLCSLATRDLQHRHRARPKTDQ
ncbi:hypothetical protein CSA57_11070 [candidate division KSB3 bacterium]|nr:MAG: hypothetical protein CSA57_11070 [candidate division KSB3 bacterium]